jgi:cytochrome P450
MALPLASEAPLWARFDPLSEAYLADPYPFLAEAREAAPVFFCEAIQHWIVTLYHDVRHALRTPPLYSARNTNSPLKPPCPMAAKALQEGGWRAVPAVANVDPPAHTRVRKIVNAAFTPKRVAEMEGYIRELAVRFCTERLRGGRADLIRDLAWEFPVLVLFKILGIPESEVARVKEGSANRIIFIYGYPTDADQLRTAHGLAAFFRYAESLVKERLAEPRDDFTSALAHARDPAGEGLPTELVATLVLNLLFAGHETTTGLLGNAFRRLLADRDAWGDLCRDPSLIPNAVEEVLRLDSSVIAWRRHLTEDAEIGGVPVPSGANLLLMLGSANRDPEVFPDPDRLDIRRPNARDHLSLGSGPHLCLGAPLARMQARIVLEEVSARFPDLRLEEGARLEFAPNVSFRGPLALPARWTEGHA